MFSLPDQKKAISLRIIALCDAERLFFLSLGLQVDFKGDLDRPFQRTSLIFDSYSRHMAGTNFDAMKESKRPNLVQVAF